MYLLNKSGQVLSETTFLDSRFLGNDSYLPPIVIPAKAGIQLATPLLFEMLQFAQLWLEMSGGICIVLAQDYD